MREVKNETEAATERVREKKCTRFTQRESTSQREGDKQRVREEASD